MLTPEQLARLRKAAEENGVTAEELIAAAEALGSEDPPEKRPGAEPGKPEPPKSEAPKLFQYLLPFVRVREVRRYMGQTDAFPGDDEIASDWAREHPIDGGDPEPPPAAE